MTNHASGSFDVTITPQPQDESESPGIARMTIDKQFHGDIEAHSLGLMLAAGTTIDNSAGYVAIEKATGTLHGRNGSFVLQHNGIMDRGAGQLAITVVPDSGTGELVGLTGTMSISIVDGEHFYEFDYTLKETR
jgi:hypothetical protein